MTCALAGNISGEATNPMGNILSEAMRQVNMEIMRAFVRLRESISKHKDLAGKLTELENRYDRQFKVVFDAIRGLMKQPDPKRRGIGFRAKFDD